MQQSEGYLTIFFSHRKHEYCYVSTEMWVFFCNAAFKYVNKSGEYEESFYVIHRAFNNHASRDKCKKTTRKILNNIFVPQYHMLCYGGPKILRTHPLHYVYPEYYEYYDEISIYFFERNNILIFKKNGDIINSRTLFKKFALNVDLDKERTIHTDLFMYPPPRSICESDLNDILFENFHRLKNMRYVLFSL